MAMTNLVTAGAASLGPRDQNGDKFRARTLYNGARYRVLDRKQQYFDCKQHDWKAFDFDGRVIVSGDGGMNAVQPLLVGEAMSAYVPLSQRRPSAPYRLSRAINLSFTDMTFGDGRFPTFAVAGDEQTHDFTDALVEATSFAQKLTRARNLGGAMGSVGLSWAYRAGKPRVRVHNAKNLFVHSWDDRDELIPRWITECFQVEREEWNEEKRVFEIVRYWKRRDWTPDGDYVFQPLRVVPGYNPVAADWQVDDERTNEHADGLTHFEWIQNIPNDEDIDGEGDVDGQHENFDALDTLVSVVFRGAVLNLDPTLKLKLDPDLVQRFGVKKGSDNALILGLEGEAEYLELAGTSLEAGVKLINEHRRQILEVARCVMPDPNEVAANGTSSVALKMMYAPMTGVVDQLRGTYGRGGKRVLKNLGDVARASMKPKAVPQPDGSSKIVQGTVDLPPKVEQEDVLDDDGNHTGEKKTTMTPRHPGNGGEVTPRWPPYFLPTPTDQGALITALSTATGQQGFMSTQTASELAAGAFGRKADDEWDRMQKQTADAESKQQQMFADTDGDAGGKVEHEKQLPDGSTIKASKGPKPKPPVQLGPDGKPTAPKGGPPGAAGAAGDLDAPDEDDEDKPPKPPKGK